MIFMFWLKIIDVFYVLMRIMVIRGYKDKGKIFPRRITHMALKGRKYQIESRDGAGWILLRLDWVYEK